MVIPALAAVPAPVDKTFINMIMTTSWLNAMGKVTVTVGLSALVRNV
jgi:hypothetical protein